MYRQTGSPVSLNKFSDNGYRNNAADFRRDETQNNQWNELDERNSSYVSTVLPNVIPTHKEKVTKDAFICQVEETGGDSSCTPANEKGSYGIFQIFKNLLRKHRSLLKRVCQVVLFLLYNVYFGFAIRSTWDETSSYCEGVKFLTVITVIAYALALYSMVIVPHVFRHLDASSLPFSNLLRKIYGSRYFSRLAWSFAWGAVLVFIITDTYNDLSRLGSAAGLVCFIFLGYVFSKHRNKIQWRQLLWGLLAQFLIGLLILRWSLGKEVFQCLGMKVKYLIDVTDKGSTFVFGYLVSGQLVDVPIQPAVFAFKVLSVVIFFSFLVSLLYHYGVMQVIVAKLGWLLQHTIGTTACESMNAAGNIFLGMTEAPLLIRPYLPQMTNSELHAVMTGGFATIAGSVLAAYINFGINASHLLTASVMAAPAALAFSKLVYPETEESLTRADSIQLEKGSESNALEAATKGATIAVKLVAHIAANLIAFVAFIALLDSIFSWMGSLVKCEYVSFEWLLSKIFVPVSLLMGVDWDDKERVANLVGLKTVVNEFVAYKRLADYSKENLISARSEAIATFALCGFSNISSIGIQLGVLCAMAPERRSDLARLSVRAMISGSVTCFLTACVAGTLLKH